MIQIDLSNVWCNLSLPELLGVEQKVSDAHAEAEDAPFQSLPAESAGEELRTIWTMAKDIRDMSDVVVVVGGGCDSLGTRGIMELLQGENRNRLLRRGKPAVCFAGHSLSMRSFEALGRMLEGKDFSVILLDGGPNAAEANIVGRAFRWMLERKYGASGAKMRIFAVCGEDSPLAQTADSAEWHCMKTAACRDGFGVLSARGLLPLCAAGVDVEKLLHGAWAEKEALNLRSYENPVWLYAAARCCLAAKGKNVEVLTCAEPDFSALSKWWQSMLLHGQGRTAPLFAAFDEPAGGLTGAMEWLAGTAGAGFATALSFEGGAGFPVVPDPYDTDGLNFLAGRKTGQLGQLLRLGNTELLTEHGVSVVSLECGEVNEENVGALVYFMQLACAISEGIMGKDTGKTEIAREYTEKMFAAFGKLTDEN